MKLTVRISASDLDLFAEEIGFNTTAPLRVSRAFLPLIKKSELKRIIFISSVLASSNITFMMADQFNAYSVAKAALNMCVFFHFDSFQPYSSHLKGSHISGQPLSNTKA